jgi:serine/threonine protein kinase
MKLENVLLDHNGHCRISDLGLAVVTKVKIKGYAGTPGYTAPEMIKNKLYGPGADIFSYGVMLYRMLSGSKPFKGKIDRDLDKAVIERKPQFPKEIFSKEAISLLSALLQKRPDNRLGCGPKGIEEIKEHPFFECIDWGLLEAGYIDPPFVPNKFDVNAASLKDIGEFDRAKYRHVKLDDRFKDKIRNFEFISMSALQEEMVSVLEKADENKNFEKFAPLTGTMAPHPAVNTAPCCSLL